MSDYPFSFNSTGKKELKKIMKDNDLDSLDDAITVSVVFTQRMSELLQKGWSIRAISPDGNTYMDIVIPYVEH